MATGGKYSDRMYVLMAAVAVVAIIFIIRLFYIQVIDDSYKLSADSNVLRHMIEFPARGLIQDRNAELLVYNQPAYDLMVIPKQMVKGMDTLGLCEVIGISKEEFIVRMKKIKAYALRKPSIFEKQLSVETYAVLQEKLYRYPGFFVQSRTLRKYPKGIASHLLGYVGEVTEQQTKDHPYYRPGDYIGISGLEKSYETELRGQKGVKVVMVDVYNRIKGSFRDGRYDTLAVTGEPLTCTIDARVQAYAEKLMGNKKGAVVAIEPATGEILALVSTPAYDPNLLVGRVRAKNFAKLNVDSLKPLFNRALMSEQNPPGSTFKLVNALIGQQVGVVNVNTRYPCRNGYSSGGLHVGCHPHPNNLDLQQSIQNSCNAYYCNVFRNIIDHTGKPWEGYAIWRRYVTGFGLGVTYGTDLPIEKKGSLPTNEFYDKYYGKNRWKSLTIISLAIGQGELGATPLQLANMAATIANRGHYYRPHLIKAIGKKPIDRPEWKVPIESGIDDKNFDVVIEGMADVFRPGGTGYRSRLESIEMCGKTGTAQNPHGAHHSIFVLFAPKIDPKIAMCVFVENAGGGSQYGAPIASLLAELYLTDTITRPDLELRMLEADLIKNPPPPPKPKKR